MMNDMDTHDGLLKPGERIDELQRNNYRIIQNTEKFCFGMDGSLRGLPVLPGETVLDLGTGTGIIPILLEQKPRKAFLRTRIRRRLADEA